MSTVVVLDYGSGNLRSAERALARAGAQVTVTADRDAALRCDGLVVPGVGAYAACMAGLDDIGGGEVIRARAAAGAPVLGICVGLQVLFARGEEHGVHTPGVGLFPGAVTALAADVLPHMGWNTVRAADGSALLADLAGERFYFVHSYAARPDGCGAAVVSTTSYGRSVFAAVIEHGPVQATQFHPEKSGDAGAHLLATWVAAL